MQEELKRKVDGGPSFSQKQLENYSAKLGTDLIREAWEEAYDLHIHGFHEHTYEVNEVKQGLPIIEKLLQYVTQYVKRKDSTKISS